MKRILLHTATLALSLSAAQAANPAIQSPAYAECTALANQQNPAAALAKAEEWLKLEDGYAAHHCRAMALYGLQRFTDAAEELSLVLSKVPPENITLRSYVARQTAKAWVSAGRTDAGITVIGAMVNELTIRKNDNVTEAKLTADLLLDRARIRLKYGQASEAVQDLDHAISLSPLNDDILMTRALAFEQLGDAPLARQDAEAVKRLNPTRGEAVELLSRLAGK